MIARTHDAAALTTLSVIFLVNPPQTISLATVIIAMIANLLGGVAPDIDQPTAPLWRNLPIGKYFGRLFGRLLGGHRFLSHSLIGLALFGFGFHWLLVFFEPVMKHVNIGYVTWAFLIGMASHLVMDTLTKEGVPWLLPVPIKFGWPPLRAYRITTDTWIETKLLFPGLIIFTCWLYFHNYDKLLFLLRHTLSR